MLLALFLLGSSACLLCLLPGRLNLIKHRRQVLQREVLLIAGQDRCSTESWFGMNDAAEGHTATVGALNLNNRYLRICAGICLVGTSQRHILCEVQSKFDRKRLLRLRCIAELY